MEWIDMETGEGSCNMTMSGKAHWNLGGRNRHYFMGKIEPYPIPSSTLSWYRCHIS